MTPGGPITAEVMTDSKLSLTYVTFSTPYVTIEATDVTLDRSYLTKDRNYLTVAMTSVSFMMAYV